MGIFNSLVNTLFHELRYCKCGSRDVVRTGKENRILIDADPNTRTPRATGWQKWSVEREYKCNKCSKTFAITGTEVTMMWG